MRKNIPAIPMPDYLTEPDDLNSQEASPFAILDRAAAQMEQRTGGLVKGEIYVAPFLGTTRYTFYLVIPTLNGYTDPLFYAWTTQPDRGYPVYLIESGAGQEDQEDFEGADAFAVRLAKLFESSWAKSRIRQWIEMAEERQPAQKAV